MCSYSLWSQEAAGWAQAIGTIAASQEAAGWAQAIGTILAILGAAWIARWQDRKTQQRNDERQIKKAKSVAGCFVPILKIIEYDVRELKILTQLARTGMTVEELRRSGYQFHELPFSVSFVLENADLLPGDAILSVPQLLSLRELTANDIRVILRHRELGHALVLYQNGLRTISTWLDMMQQLIDEIYEIL